VLRIAIADDEEIFRRRISDFLEEYLVSKMLEYEVELYDSGREITEMGNDIRYFDIFFLDVSMHDVDGIKTAKEIRKYSEDAFIVFVTAYIDYSIEGYKVNAIRYVLKDRDHLEDSLTECMNAILKKMARRNPVMQLHFNEGIKEIFIDKVLYIESSLHKLTFHFVDDSNYVLTMYQTLNAMERKLSGYSTFIRVHQSFLVNLRYIETVNHYTVFLNTGEEMSVPKARYGDVKKAFITYKGEV
jgi:DNA-binding LytR/AlgR family response regulator